MLGKRSEPTPEEVHDQPQPCNLDVETHRQTVSNRGLTGASALTVRQSIFPITLVTVLFFLWGFAYGLLDVLNAKFQTALNITAAKAGGKTAPPPLLFHSGLFVPGSCADTIPLAQVCKVPTSAPTSSGP